MKTEQSRVFSDLILEWFDQHGRKNLPWQQAIDPYRVWVSEIMLQQTQVKTVIPYFERFISRFPSVNCLATAQEDEVMTLWAGLGYYARARNLYKAARMVWQEFNGQFPLDLEVLQTLPGIGRSTAGAILAIAGKKRATILDGNVRRVLARVHGIEEWPGEAKTLQKLWEIAEEYTPSLRVADYTQAIMDLGATVCGKKPNCLACPLKMLCHAYKTQTTAAYPVKKSKKSLPFRSTAMVILKHDMKVLLQKRPPVGIWGGLWSFPAWDDSEENGFLENAIIKMVNKEMGYEVENLVQWPAFKHTFTHFHLEIKPWIMDVREMTNKVMENNCYLWYGLDEREPAIPAPVKKILNLVRSC